MNEATRLRPTDVPQRVLSWYAEKLGVDACEVVDRLVVRGDDILISMRGFVDGGEVCGDNVYTIVWSRDDDND
jgi:hypothetical protein